MDKLIWQFVPCSQGDKSVQKSQSGEIFSEIVAILPIEHLRFHEKFITWWTVCSMSTAAHRDRNAMKNILAQLCQ